VLSAGTVPGVLKFRALPWLLLLDVALVTTRYLRQIAEEDRARVIDIALRSKGLPHKVTAQERDDLMRVARTIDWRGAAAEMAPRGTRRVVRGRKK